jgi:hypothetical protein
VAQEATQTTWGIEDGSEARSRRLAAKSARDMVAVRGRAGRGPDPGGRRTDDLRWEARHSDTYPPGEQGVEEWYVMELVEKSWDGLGTHSHQQAQEEFKK